MAWVKVPLENHPLFRAALPVDPRVQTMNMFGGIAATVNGNMFAGLFARSVVLQLTSDADRAEALALDGAGPFDPMGNGRVMSDKIMLPESVMDEPAELRAWIARAFEACAKLPRKVKKQPAARKPAAKQAIVKPKKPQKSKKSKS